MKAITDAVQYLFADTAGQKVVSDGLGYMTGAKPLTIGGIFNMIGFAIAHPIHTFNLIRLGTSPDIYNNEEFQKEVLKPKSSVWSFLKNPPKYPDPDPKNLGKDTDILRDVVRHYDVEENILGIIPHLEKHGKGLVDINTSLRTNPFFVSLEKMVKMVTEDEEKKLSNFVSENPTAISSLSKSLIDNIAYVKDTTEGYDFDTEILDLLDTLLVKPEEAKKILESYNRGEYTQMTKAIIEVVNDEKIGKDLSRKLQDQAEKGLFTKLTQATLDQDEKWRKDNNLDILNSYKNILANYGISDDGIAKLGDALKTLLNDPKGLQKVFGHFEKGDYTGMVKEILTVAENNPELAQFIKDNKEAVFTPIISSIGNKYKDQLKEYGIDDKGVEKLGDVLNILLDDPASFRRVLNHIEAGNYTEMVKEIFSTAEHNPQIAQFVKDNKEMLIPIVSSIVNDIPAVQRYTRGTDVSGIVMPIVQSMLDNPAQMKKIIEESEKGTRSSFAKTLVESIPSLMSTELAKEVSKTIMSNIYSIFSGSGGKVKEQKQGIVNALIKDNLKEPHSEKVNLSELLQTAVKDLEEKDPDSAKKLKKLIKSNIFSLGNIEGANFTNVTIDGQSFVNSTIKDTNFAGTSIVGAHFMGASFEKVDFSGANITNTSFSGAKFGKGTIFKGATIDRSTLESMLPQLKQGAISLEGVNLQGDLSNLDLSGISLKGADLSKVTSLVDSNLHNSNIKEANFGDNVNLQNSIAIEPVVSDISDKMFGKGHSRTSDLDVIRTVLKKTEIDPKNLEGPVIDNIIDELNKHSKYTKAGLVTGGVYLPEGLENDAELIKSVKNIAEQHKLFSKEELNIIESMGKQIAENLGIKEEKLITDTLKENFYQFKKDKGIEDLSGILEQKEKSIVGQVKVEKGWVSNTILRTGLTDLFYKNSQYTKAGLVTGGIKLDEDKIKSEEFSKQLYPNIEQNLNIEKNMEPDFRSKIRESQVKVGKERGGRG